MKHIIIKKISPTKIARVTVSLADSCDNGLDEFGYTCDIFDIRGNRGETAITFGGHVYRETSSDNGKEFMLTHFAELEPIFTLAGCDAKGLPCYPLMNGAFWLDTDIKYAMNAFRITKKEAETIKHYKPLSLAKFWYKLTETRYKKEVNTAIELLESLTKEKYKPSTNVSAHLYNDLHYTMVTEKEGWNIHKGEKNKNKLQYHLDITK